MKIWIAALLACGCGVDRARTAEDELLERLAVGPKTVRLECLWKLDAVGGLKTLRALAPLVESVDAEIADRAAATVAAIWNREGAEMWPALPKRYRTAWGRILTAGGEPVAGTEVRWILDRRPARTPELAARRIGRAITKSDGSFTMEAPRWPGMLSLWVLTQGGWSVLHGASYPGINYLQSDEPWVVPPRDTEIRLRVVDAKGARLPGAHAELVFSVRGAPLADRDWATPGRDGIIRIGPIDHDNYWLDVIATGHAPQRVCAYQFLATDAPDRAVPVTLYKARRVRVQRRAGQWVSFRFEWEGGTQTDEGWFVRADRMGVAEFSCPLGKTVFVGTDEQEVAVR